MATRVRYAPSPTGDLHLGSLRTVIFDWLVARQDPEGKFILRVEDTDQTRFVEGSLERQLKALRWMGLEPDEGACLDEQGNVIEKGNHGPYTQSKRLEIYATHAEFLRTSGHAYRCFCTPDRLEEMRAQQAANHQPPKYDRRCRALSTEESDARAAAGEKFVIRHAIPDGQEVRFHDMVRGELVFKSDELDDYVLLKSDGFPTYHLASVVDDTLMEITHVLRGEEWLPSLPKNLLLYAAFSWQAPRFAHLPVILGPDGKHKLSKRDGDVSVLDYEAKGYLPDALFNMLAMIGWSPGTEEEFFTRESLAKRFSLERVQRAAAVFNFQRLDFVNGWYIRQMTVGEVAARMTPFLLASGFIEELADSADRAYWPVHEVKLNRNFSEYMLTVAAAVQERLKHFDESAEAAGFFFKRPEVNEDLRLLVIPKKGEWEKTKKILGECINLLSGLEEKQWAVDRLDEHLRLHIEMNEYKNMEVLWPIRAALTGSPASPGAFEMLAVLGREESLARLQPVATMNS